MRSPSLILQAEKTEDRKRVERAISRVGICELTKVEEEKKEETRQVPGHCCFTITRTKK